jgi:hypothetical protein
MTGKRGIAMFEIETRIRWVARSGAIVYGTITRVDEDGTVWGTFDDGVKFVRDKVKDIEVVEDQPAVRV